MWYILPECGAIFIPTFNQVCAFLPIALFVAFMIARYYESGAAREYVRELHKVWVSLGIPGRVVIGALVVMCTLHGGSKGVNPAASLFRVLFWHGDDWALLPAFDKNTQAKQAVHVSTNLIAAAICGSSAVTDYVATNNVITYSFDWHAPNRLPYHDRQNVLGRTVKVTPRMINGILHEDHYVAFNESATTNPAVILIEYCRKLDDGSIERYAMPTLTNSYPDMVAVTLQSGTHNCYWFRCEVPTAFTNCCVRDWNGEALFGSPQDSGKGFDLLGMLLIDDGDNIWEGATTNIIMDTSVNYPVRNGIIGEPIYALPD
jgi:hypothetical protein